MTKKTINDVWRHIYPIKERKVSQNSISNLVVEKPKWKNLPTKPIRVPAKFINEITKFAKILDEGIEITTYQPTEGKDMEQAIGILEKSLKLKPNNGSAIKREIKQALTLLKKEDTHHS